MINMNTELATNTKKHAHNDGWRDGRQDAENGEVNHFDVIYWKAYLAAVEKYSGVDGNKK